MKMIIIGGDLFEAMFTKVSHHKLHSFKNMNHYIFLIITWIATLLSFVIFRVTSKHENHGKDNFEFFHMRIPRLFYDLSLHPSFVVSKKKIRAWANFHISYLIEVFYSKSFAFPFRFPKCNSYVGN